MGNPEALVDYAYRANHEMTVAAKSIISGFYGTGPARSYWIGCSLGGLQGLIEAKRYPEDYDGIVAGAPPNPLTLFNAAQLWPNWLLHRSPAMALPPEKYRLLHAAILKDCASVAGQALGYVDDPSRCAYDPARLACRKGDNPGCLTRAQVAFVRLVWRGPVNSRTGKLIFPGPAKGSELEWGPFVNGKEFVNALDLYRYAAFQQPQWSSLSMNWARDVEAAANKIAPLMHVDDDLTAFTGRGGRLLLYVGWNDYHNPLELAGYMSRIHARIGEKAQHYVRMFAIPGMNHCASGAGCDSWDKIDAIDAWVDRKQGLQPRSAVRYEQGRVVRTQPLCYWPQMPVYDGIGPKEDQSSYACRAIGAETGDPHE
jgi:feruloyl esterase